MPSDLEQPEYKLYRSGPKGLRARLRGEDDELQGPAEYRRYKGSHDRGTGRRITPKRVILGVIAAIAAWLLLSLVLFLISAQTHSGGPLVAAAEPELSPAARC